MTTCVEYRARPYRAFECATSGSVIARYWSVMRRRAVAQVEHDLVDIAPAPALGRGVTFDDRVPCHREVPRRMRVRRLVAAVRTGTPRLPICATPACPELRPYRRLIPARL